LQTGEDITCSLQQKYCNRTGHFQIGYSNLLETKTYSKHLLTDIIGVSYIYTNKSFIHASVHCPDRTINMTDHIVVNEPIYNVR